MGRRLCDDAPDKLPSGRMTLATVGSDAAMVHQGPAECYRGFMASLTSQRGGNMIGRLEQPFDCRRSTGIMTIKAAGGDACVVVGTSCEGPSRPNSMTTVAGLIGWNVIGGFPGGLDSIVASGAGTGSNSSMREGDCRPHRRTMACVARLRRWNMGRRFPLLDGVVMAFGTGSRNDTIVGKKGRHPVGRSMATVAIHRRWKMIFRFER